MFKGFTKGITKRWMLNNLSVIVTIVVLAVIGLILTVSYNFNSSVEVTLNSASNELSSVFPGYKSENSTSFLSTARSYVENFIYKEKMEVMVINSTGRVTMTSTGFN